MMLYNNYMKQININKSILLNFNYTVLKTLYENQVKYQGEFLCLLTQDALCDKLHASKTSVNHALKELSENGYIVASQKKTKFSLTKEATQLVKWMEGANNNV